MKKVRCAIYTRKSSEEGLEQDFNSLDAQREACAAYVMSQASEGWNLLPEHYDDGGISGGTLERPALQRLLADVAAGQIDIIVVYKVDRLTRSLLDFAKLVEALDKAEVSFVSVTQSFNTTTSMGRLTLNMLLSFAQFEREVTAERIRDKISASKAKGMWMGGTPPLGYKPHGRSLAIVEDEAALIRTIYRRYLELGAVRKLADWLVGQGIGTPVRLRGNGGQFGGGSFSRGQLYAILRNPIYAGEIAHRGSIYPGLHEAIIDRATWDAVQHMLADHTQGDRSVRAPTGSLLAGKIVDANGEPLVAAHATKAASGGKVRYRYYVSKAVQEASTSKGLRIPAREIEQVVVREIAGLFDDPLALVERARLEIAPSALPGICELCRRIAYDLRAADRTICSPLIGKVHIEDSRVRIAVRSEAIAALLKVSCREPDMMIELVADARLTRTGRAVQLVQSDGALAAGPGPNQSLANLIAKACRWWKTLSEGETDIKRLADIEGVSASYMTRVVRLAFLAPEIVEGALSGTLKPGVDGTALLATGALPAHWSEQRLRFAVS